MGLKRKGKQKQTKIGEKATTSSETSSAAQTPRGSTGQDQFTGKDPSTTKEGKYLKRILHTSSLEERITKLLNFACPCVELKEGAKKMVVTTE